MTTDKVEGMTGTSGAINQDIKGVIMNEEEIRAAASSAVNRIGEEREEFIRGNYPKEDFDRIVRMCNWLDDAANNAVEERAFRPCIIGKSYEY